MPQQQTIGDMTIEQLEAFVQSIIRRETIEYQIPDDEERDQRSLDEIFASIDENMIILPPGAKSSLDLLREDRDR